MAANGSATTAGTPGVINTIGSTAAPASFFTGYIAEIIVYSSVLSAGDITTVESYLTSKYVGVIGQTRLLWLKGDAITGKIDGDTISQWLDSSGQGVRVIVPTPGNVLYKTNLQNSLPGVRFDTNAQAGCATDCLLATTDYSVYVVYDYRSATPTGRRAIQGTANNWLIGPYDNTHKCYSGGFSTGLTVVQNQFVIQWVIGSGSNNTNYVNGTAYTSGGSTLPGVIGLGTKGAFAEPLDGDILEIIIENRADDSTQMAAIKNYLASKYNITEA